MHASWSEQAYGLNVGGKEQHEATMAAIESVKASMQKELHIALEGITQRVDNQMQDVMARLGELMQQQQQIMQQQNQLVEQQAASVPLAQIASTTTGTPISLMGSGPGLGLGLGLQPAPAAGGTEAQATDEELEKRMAGGGIGEDDAIGAQQRAIGLYGVSEAKTAHGGCP